MNATIETIVLLKGAAVGAWFLIWFALERFRPAAREWVQSRLQSPSVGTAASSEDDRRLGRFHRWFRNGALFAINTLLSPVIVIPLSTVMAAYGPDWRPDWVGQAYGGWAGLVLDILLLDLFIYAWHRANHVVPVLWRFHQVHHFDRHLDTTSAVRFHFGEVVLSAIMRGLYVGLMDIPLTSVLVFEAVVLLCSIFHHSNARLPSGVERALSMVIITPGIHWVHHHAVRKDTDSNYGTLFSFWDRLFGSRSKTTRWAEMPIGLEGEATDKSLVGLLLAPLQKPR